MRVDTRRTRAIVIVFLFALTGCATTEAPRPAGQATTTEASSRLSGKRSQAARRQFMEQSGYPKGRPGYVVNHILPLACGGADTPGNMQWLTIADAKTKELKGCGQSAPASAPIPTATAATPTPAPQTSSPPIARQQCAATTKKGSRCSRLASPGSRYCWQHGG